MKTWLCLTADFQAVSQQWMNPQVTFFFVLKKYSVFSMCRKSNTRRKIPWKINRSCIWKAGDFTSSSKFSFSISWAVSTRIVFNLLNGACKYVCSFVCVCLSTPQYLNLFLTRHKSIKIFCNCPFRRCIIFLILKKRRSPSYPFFIPSLISSFSE